jgi:excisionase family DNA binding protein
LQANIGEKAFKMFREQYQTVREVADLLKVNKATVRHWIKDGRLGAIDLGKGWRIAPRDCPARSRRIP